MMADEERRYRAPMALRHRRFDLIEACGILSAGAFVAVAVLSSLWPLSSQAQTVVESSAGRAITDELTPFVTRYGPDKYSSHEEEFFIRDYFGQERNGVFLDVGSGHYRERSNTYYLEHVLDWTGLAIDAQSKFAADYARHRPATKFFALFVSDVSDETARLFVGANDLFSSSNRRFTEGYVSIAGETEVPTVTLTDLLTAERVTHVDFMSMDIELAEPKALKGFDIRRFRPRLVAIESHPEVRQQILDYFQAQDYVVVGRYLRADPQNLWFAPKGTRLPDADRGTRYSH